MPFMQFQSFQQYFFGKSIDSLNKIYPWGLGAFVTYF